MDVPGLAWPIQTTDRWWGLLSLDGVFIDVVLGVVDIFSEA